MNLTENMFAEWPVETVVLRANWAVDDSDEDQLCNHNYFSTWFHSLHGLGKIPECIDTPRMPSKLVDDV
ncbi:MAG: hypothetical protein Q9178_003295 [Gyalolechia marmorata]